MRNKWIFLFLLFAQVAYSNEQGKGEQCHDYKKYENDVAYKKFKDMQIRSGELGVQLAKFQRDGVPDNDPKSSAVAIELGTLLGGMYQFCTCNTGLSLIKDCIAHKQMMESVFQQDSQ
jgi:hypothetical protein